MDRTTHVRFRQSNVQLLITDLQIGYAFAKLAQETKNESNRRLNRLNAREAYEFAKNNAAKVAPDQREAEEIRAGLEQLKAALKLLGETNLE